MSDIPADSLWAYRDEFGGLPVLFLYIEKAHGDSGLLQSTFLGTAFSEHQYLDEVKQLTRERFWELVDQGKLERIDDPSVAILLPFVEV